VFLRRRERRAVHGDTSFSAPTIDATDGTSAAIDDAAQQQREQLEEWRRSAQRVTRTWNSWLAAEHRDRRDLYDAFVAALAEEEQAAAGVKRLIRLTATRDHGTPTR
jgi:hypothetical protein